MERSRRGEMAVLATVAALAGAALIPGAASAYTYDVTVATTRPEARRTTAGAHTRHRRRWCSAGMPRSSTFTNFSTGLWVRNHQAATWVALGGLGGWNSSAPAGDDLDSVTATYWTSRRTRRGCTPACRTTSRPRAGCSPSATELCADQGTNRYIPLTGSSEVRVEVGCLDPAPGCGNASTNSVFLLYGARVTRERSTPPTIRPSGDLWTAAWQRGVRGILVTGLDSADGIQENEIRVDGKTYESRGHACDYTLRHSLRSAVRRLVGVDSSSSRTASTSSRRSPMTGAAADGRLGSIYEFSITHRPSRRARTWRVPRGGEARTTSACPGPGPAQGNGSPIVAGALLALQGRRSGELPVADRRMAGDDIEA